MASRPLSPRATSASKPTLRLRLPLSGGSPRRLSYDRRVRLWTAALVAPSVVLTGVLVFEHTASLPISVAVALAVALLWAAIASFFVEQIIRPLQTLSNVVAALREDDFSFRARGARRGDSLGDLALEVNALASTLQHQRSAALDALSLVELVMTSMQSPVLAFDASSQLHLLNPAAEGAFGLRSEQVIGRTAKELDLVRLVEIPDQGLYDPAGKSGEMSSGARWSVRRTTFRLDGVPHTLFVLADVAAALREEERLAWQKLIRVLGHEINNSLTPIKSIAGSLRSRLSSADLEGETMQPSLRHGGATGQFAFDRGDFDRGLAVIEDRADSLNRFLQAYQRLSRLPAPNLQPTLLEPLVARLVPLETRLPVQVNGGPNASVLADPDQLQQLLINLIRNAADAALALDQASPQREPRVEITWSTTAMHSIVRIVDNGAGLMSTANLFVPFYTTKPGGTGVGLLLAQQIATAHQGTVTLKNRVDSPGCEAEVHLPRIV